MLVLLALSLLASGTRAACDACVGGYCHERRTILAGFSITDQLAIEEFNDILYLQLNENLNIALILNNVGSAVNPETRYRSLRYNVGIETRLISIKNTKGMAVSHKNNELYMGSKEAGTLFFKYNPLSNTTEAVPATDDHKSPYLLHSSREFGLVLAEAFENNTTAFHFFQDDTSLPIYTKLVNYTINYFAVENEKLYFVSKDTLYVYRLPSMFNSTEPPTAILKKDHIVLNIDRYGSIYIGDATNKVIYRLDDDKKLEIYAAYEKGYVEDFVFAAMRNIIYRDADGSLGEFVKNQPEITCFIEPPHDTYYIRQSDRLNRDEPRYVDSSGYSSSWNRRRFE